MGVKSSCNLNTLFFFFFLFLIFFSLQSKRAFADDLRRPCHPTRCNTEGPIIKYPFRTTTQPASCGLEGFELSCSQNQTLLHMPSFGNDFFVREIIYSMPAIFVSDPNGCLFQRVLALNLSSSPFHPFYMPPAWIRNITYIQCSEEIPEFPKVPCLVTEGTDLFIVNSSLSMTAISNKCETNTTFPLATDSYRPVPILNTTINLPISLEDQLFLTWSLPTNKRGLKAKVILIGICVGGGIFITATLMLTYHIYRKTFKLGDRENQLKVEKILKECRSLNIARYSYSNIKKITQKFNYKIGKGGYGTVYKGKLSNGTLVAVKILENSRGHGEEFINEIVTIGRVHHVNVVRLLGFCSEGTKQALVYEFMPNESLENFIFYREGNTCPFLGWNKLLEIAIGIARGIEYLHHGCNHCILHHDIKPQNILLDNHLNPKISDFGLAKICSNIQSNAGRMSTRGTMGYIAPEVFSRTFGVVSYKSDVYSFGMVMLEMVGGKKMSDSGVGMQGDASFPEWICREVEKGMDDDDIARKLTIVALWCIQWNPNDRPAMKRIVKMLQGTENLLIPPKPFVSSSLSFPT